MASFTKQLKEWLGQCRSWLHARSGAPSPEPELVFARFQEVLRANNQALQLIADLGEKLGGDFLFDRRYIETTIAGLGEAVAAAIAALNRLRGGALLELLPVHQRLTAELQQVLAGREDREGAYCLAFDQVRPLDWGLVGGKGAHLAELHQDPLLNVPNGFIVTSRAYHQFIDDNGLRPRLEAMEQMLADPNADPSRLEELRLELEHGIGMADPPPWLSAALSEALLPLTGGNGTPLFLAVRSSAQEEDREYSFAGQFRSLLNVPAALDPLFLAYREVVASLFGQGVVAYRRLVSPGEGGMSIAVVCQPMVAARTSGVAYSLDPQDPGAETILVAAAWGQGAAVVEGKTPTDTFHLGKGEPPQITGRHLARKEQGLYLAASDGLEYKPVPPSLQDAPSLSDPELLQLGRQVMHLELVCKRPQDVEWSIDEDGVLHILQTRALLLPASSTRKQELPLQLGAYPLVSAGEGRVAQQGIGAGPVHHVNRPEELAGFPEGAVLVARRDSSQFVKVMQRAAAIVTETGTPVSHMSTLCREFQLPCLVNVPGICTKVAAGEEITVDAEDRRIYRGRVKELLTYRATTPVNLGGSREFRLLRRLLRKVSRLHLIDPLLQEFTPGGCQTYHDLLRFIHEEAVLTLVEVGRNEGGLLKSKLARPMDLPVPAGIMVIDIGGGVSGAPPPPAPLPFKAIASTPFRAILQGMLYPGVWHRGAMAVGMRDLMSSMLSAPSDTLDGRYSGHNIAIVSRDYVNLCFRLGYHFNIIDAHCSSSERDNHIYFRFLGGATDLIKRSRRATMIGAILTASDFQVQIKGDLVIARAGNMPQAEMERTLDLLGRLVGFTRQLDVRLDRDAVVNRYVNAFLSGNYGIVDN